MLAAPQAPDNPFEAIRHYDEQGREYWQARELGQLLEYRQWFYFKGVLDKAVAACLAAGQSVDDHMWRVPHMVQLGSGSKRKVDDYHLSRFACYLVCMNADPDKEVVALGQAYFAVQTRRMELAERDVATLTEDERRLLRHSQYRASERRLHLNAGEHGVEDIPGMRAKGHRGLYGGETREATGERKGVDPRFIPARSISAELMANALHFELTSEGIVSEEVDGDEQAGDLMYEIGVELHDTIARLGRIVPEQQPTPPTSIADIARQLVLGEATDEDTDRSPQQE